MLASAWPGPLEPRVNGVNCCRPPLGRGGLCYSRGPDRVARHRPAFGLTPGLGRPPQGLGLRLRWPRRRALGIVLPRPNSNRLHRPHLDRMGRRRHGPPARSPRSPRRPPKGRLPGLADQLRRRLQAIADGSGPPGSATFSDGRGGIGPAHRGSTPRRTDSAAPVRFRSGTQRNQRKNTSTPRLLAPGHLGDHPALAQSDPRQLARGSAVLGPTLRRASHH
jgi:hypothetical protein